jgi:hypothetical protein
MQLTLDDVVRSGQEGMRFGQQQKAYKQQQVDLAQARADKDKERALMDSSEQAVRQVMADDMAEHVANGGDPAAYKPSSRAMLRSVEARGAAFARAGDIKRFMENHVLSEKPRMAIRARAIQEYEATKDFGKFAKDFYSTIPDGVDVVGYEEVRGGGPDAPKGAPSGKTMYRLKFSNGKSDLVDPEKLYDSAQKMLQDPMTTVKQTAEVALAAAKAKAKGDDDRLTIKARGEQDRLTAQTRGAATLEAAEVRADATRDAAKIRVDGSIKIAEIRGPAKGSGGGGRGGTLADTGGPKVQSRMTDANGNVILVMRDGTHKQLVGDDGQPVRSLDYQKLLGRTATDISRTTGDPLPASREAAKTLLKPDPQAPAARPASPASGARLDQFRVLRNGN